MLMIKSGTSFVVGGALIQKDKKNLANYQCILDNTITLPSMPSSNNVGVLCQQDSLSNGTHTITLTATRTYSSSTSQLWVDYFLYTPSSPPSPGDALLMPFNWSQIEYAGMWANSKNGMGMSTNVNNAGLSVNFTGGHQLCFNSTSSPTFKYRTICYFI